MTRHNYSNVIISKVYILFEFLHATSCKKTVDAKYNWLDYFETLSTFHFIGIRNHMLAFILSSVGFAEDPADMLPKPRPKTCIEFSGGDQNSDSEEATYAMAEGLPFNQVFSVLNETVQYALYCEQPDGYSALNMTFDLTIGCNGIIKDIEIVDHGGAPDSYLNCVTSVLYRANFPAHDMPDGQMVTYPVNVAW